VAAVLARTHVVEVLHQTRHGGIVPGSTCSNMRNNTCICTACRQCIHGAAFAATYKCRVLSVSRHTLIAVLALCMPAPAPLQPCGCVPHCVQTINHCRPTLATTTSKVVAGSELTNPAAAVCSLPPACGALNSPMSTGHLRHLPPLQ
jgi:hypothetical protein